ncbi:MAG: hypothetical protein OS112_02595 [Methanoregula sp.]|nr:MAG: hypothetical protein OS112_02595 [Methanoregula sp.]
MSRKSEIPVLLEQYMEHHGGSEQWITVKEFRTYFQLDEIFAPIISGFFCRLSQGSFLKCPYRVARIEKLIMTKPQRRMIKRYLITRRPEPRKKQATRSDRTQSFIRQ